MFGIRDSEKNATVYTLTSRFVLNSSTADHNSEFSEAKVTRGTNHWRSFSNYSPSGSQDKERTVLRKNLLRRRVVKMWCHMLPSLSAGLMKGWADQLWSHYLLSSVLLYSEVDNSGFQNLCVCSSDFDAFFISVNIFQVDGNHVYSSRATSLNAHNSFVCPLLWRYQLTRAGYNNKISSLLQKVCVYERVLSSSSQ